MHQLRLPQNFMKDDRINKLARLLRISPHAAIGYLVNFWLYVLAHCELGQLKGVLMHKNANFETIANEINWVGDCEEFISALEAANFIEIDKNNKTIQVNNKDNTMLFFHIYP